MVRGAGFAVTVVLVVAMAMIPAIATDAAHIGGEGHGEGIDAVYTLDKTSYLRISLSTKPIDRIDVLLISGHDATQVVQNLLIDKNVIVELRPLMPGTYDLRIQLHSTQQLLAECDLIIGHTFSVTFLPGEGSGSMDGMEVSEGAEITVPASVFTAPDGSRFDHWSSEGKEYAEGDKVVISGDTSFTAVYKETPAEADGPDWLSPLAIVCAIGLLLILVLVVRRRNAR